MVSAIQGSSWSGVGDYIARPYQLFLMDAWLWVILHDVVAEKVTVLVVDVVIVVSCLVTWSLGSYFSLLWAANLREDSSLKY